MLPPPPALEAEPVLTVEMTAPVWKDTERDPGPSPPDSALARGMGRRERPGTAPAICPGPEAEVPQPGLGGSVFNPPATVPGWKEMLRVEAPGKITSG